MFLPNLLITVISVLALKFEDFSNYNLLVDDFNIVKK